jgi:hypothetical protein
MKREKTSNRISQWRKTILKDGASTTENTVVIPVSLSSKNKEPETAVPSLAFFNQEPVTFRLSRLENPKDFERMLFVIKACTKEKNVSFTSVLHVEQTRTGSRLIAIDGRRLHVAEISKKIKSGDYKAQVTKDIISLGKPLKDIKFPAWAKAIPVTTVKRGVINLTDSGIGKNSKETDKLSLAFSSFVSHSGEPINLRYLNDLTKKEWEVYCQNDKQKAIVLREKSKGQNEPDRKAPYAVIMPLEQAA